MSDLKMRNHVGLFVFRMSAHYNNMQSTARISVYVIIFIVPYLLYTPTLEFQNETYAN